MKRKIFIFTFLSVALFSCNGNTPPPVIKPTLPQIEVSKLVTQNGQTHLEVENVPFPLLGAQIRLDALLFCDKYTIEEVENYFVKAKELGLNCVQIPIPWNLIEHKKEQFNFNVVDKILSYALKYDLKIELLWFSTNMCGDSFSYLVPQYILNEPGKKLRRDNNGAFWNYYGYTFSLILNDAWVLENEKRAITELFNHIREWDDKNGNTRPVITAQIHNEPDCFIRWRIDQYHISTSDNKPLEKSVAWRMTLDALNEVGKAVKASSYKVATRVNVVMGTGLDGYWEFKEAKPSDVFHLDGIDFLSVDPYKSGINEVKKEVLAYKSLLGNYPLVAENKGVYTNTPSLILATVALGGGYDIYDLATSKFFIDNTSADFRDQIDHGVYTWDLKEKAHTPKVRKILKGLIAAAPVVASVNTGNFAAFNVVNDSPRNNSIQSIQTEQVKTTFSTNSAALGFAVDNESALFVYATENAIFKISNADFGKVEKGIYNAKGQFVVSAETVLELGNELKAEPEVLYKINYSNASKLTSNTLLFIGSN